MPNMHEKPHFSLADALARHAERADAKRLSLMIPQWSADAQSAARRFIPALCLTMEPIKPGFDNTKRDDHTEQDTGPVWTSITVTSDVMRIALTQPTLVTLVALAFGAKETSPIGRRDRKLTQLELNIASHLLDVIFVRTHSHRLQDPSSPAVPMLRWVEDAVDAPPAGKRIDLMVTMSLGSWSGSISVRSTWNQLGTDGERGDGHDAGASVQTNSRLPGFVTPTPVTVQAFSWAVPMTFADIMAIQVGDTLSLIEPDAQTVILQVQDNELFKATLGRHGHRLVARVISTLGT